jgi:hypothetical protein
MRSLFLRSAQRILAAQYFQENLIFHVQFFSLLSIALNRNGDEPPPMKRPVMNLSNPDHFALLSRLPDEGKVVFAARCARLAVQILNGMSFPIAAADRAELEKVVRLAEETATRWVEPTEFKLALRDLGHLAFISPAPLGFHSDVVLSYVAHAVYAAGLTVLTGSTAHAQDALDYTLEAARAAGAADVEASVREGLYSLRRLTVVSTPIDPASKTARNTIFA